MKVFMSFAIKKKKKKKTMTVNIGTSCENLQIRIKQFNASLIQVPLLVFHTRMGEHKQMPQMHTDTSIAIF